MDQQPGSSQHPSPKALGPRFRGDERKLKLILGAVLALTFGSLSLAQEPAPTPSPTAADWRTVPADALLVIDTNRGRILVEMAPEAAPLHVERMRVLARRAFFDGIVFHRVIDLFMAQTGDPLGNGEGQSPYPDLVGEFTFRRGPEMPFTPVAEPAGSMLGFMNSLPIQTQPTALMATTADGKVHGWGAYCPGVAGMARDEAPNSANSQFFLMRQPYPALDKRYTVWGRVVSGLEVVRAIKTGDAANNGMVPSDPDIMTRVRVASDLPEDERPVVQVLDAGSAAFQTLAQAARTARGADFSICDIDLPVQVSGAPAPAT
ncbi:MAG: peptidylprolyl isomerase [Brevundimonas subvibrioides]|uniref:peptidylprolyl isomerase n=1 Tax=Brevundimonas subvibrioides TaxID=74313 RepID=A0A258FNH0_9CAUL|nr:MAG: peptidylprolyl isomerase [Brevundimonas subvibrioides]